MKTFGFRFGYRMPIKVMIAMSYFLGLFFFAQEKYQKKAGYCLEPQTTIYKWLFQLDDSQSLHRKWLFHQTSIYKWLFGVPGDYLDFEGYEF